jgi:hypothetical protein
VACQRGWQVTALDVSQVVLERASAAIDAAGVTVRWVHSGLADAQMTPEGFDLVSAQHPALLGTPEHEAERTLIGAVAPGGYLIVVHHADMDFPDAKEAGCDSADYVSPSYVAVLLDDNWQVVFDARRPRAVTGGAEPTTHMMPFCVRTAGVQYCDGQEMGRRSINWLRRSRLASA